MIPLIRIGEPVVVALVPEPTVIVTPPSRDPRPSDPEEAYRLARERGWSDDLAAIWAASAAGLPVLDEKGDSIRWTMREVRRHIFGRYLIEHGHGDGDIDGGTS